MDATLENREWLSPKIFSLTLSLPQALQAKPGQFVLVQIPDHPQRAYSIVEENDKKIILGIQVEQHTSKALSTLPLNSTLKVLGPFGSFTPRESKTVSLIAGGIGVTPLVSIYQYYKNKNCDIEVFLSARETFVFSEYFDTPHLINTSKQSRLKAIDINPDSTVFICGPTSMIETIRSELINQGHDPEQIFSEEFS